MILSRFNKIFNIEGSEEEERKKFLIRINLSIFTPLFDNYNENKLYLQLLERICFVLGVEKEKLFEENLYGEVYAKGFFDLTRNDFVYTLKIIVIIVDELKKTSVYTNRHIADHWLNLIEIAINNALSVADPILNLRWVDGMFYPAGDTTLDIKVIQDAYEKLIPYDNEKMDLKNALENLIAGDLYGVVGKCYNALEGITKVYLRNAKTLSGNDKDLIVKLNFPNGFKNMFNGYMTYAQEYHRHAGDNRHKINYDDVETFLYLTCVFIKLIVGRMNENKKAV